MAGKVFIVIACPNCGRDNPQGTKICVYCGAMMGEVIEQVSTRTLGDTDYEEGRPQWGTARFNARMSLIINIRDSKDRFSFFFDEITELLLGRGDPQTGAEPDINLEAYGAADMGVSRRHAVIVRRETALNVIDLDTPNGTFLNGQRLIAHQPRVLRDGDELRLGHMVLRVSFARM